MTRGGRPSNVAVLVAVLVAALGGCGHPPAPSALSGTVVAQSTTAATTAVPSTTTPAASSVPPTTPRTAVAATVARPKASVPAAPTTRATPQPCPDDLARQLADTRGGAQLVTVDAASATATTATVALWQRTDTGCWISAGGPWPARVGFNGLSARHVEGDGTTPAGAYHISSHAYGLSPDPDVHGSYHQLVCGDWWDEDPGSPQYNSFQHVACGSTPPFGGKSEALWTETTASQRFAVVEYNTNPVVAGAGSAIFIHDDDGGPTNGCISLPAPQLDTLLRWLQPSLAPVVVIGTDAEIRRL